MQINKNLLCAASVLFACAVCFHFVQNYFEDPESVLHGLALAGFIFLCANSFFMLFWGVSTRFYRAADELPEVDLPEITVVVPAYNEGMHVAKTLRSLLDSDYPAEKLQIIAVNDGSKDDTWNWIQRTAIDSDERILPINLIRNQGKKHALACGIRASAHPFIVTVDSDSLVERATLRHIVAPFRDPRVGAVAGSLVCGNRSEGVYPKLLDAVLVSGCEFLRAAESVTGCVVCTPGALSAYRKEILLAHLEEWLNQRFLGEPAVIGEDRAITTLILSDGYRVVHQKTARAETNMPVNYAGMCRMLIRWTRSDIRENFRMTGFFFTPELFRNPRRWILLFQWIPLVLNVTLPVVSFPLLMLCPAGMQSPGMFLLSSVCGVLFFSAIPAVVYAECRPGRDAVWAVLYGLFVPLALFWICPWSFLTMRNSRWMTRELPKRTRYSREMSRIFLHIYADLCHPHLSRTRK